MWQILGRVGLFTYGPIREKLRKGLSWINLSLLRCFPRIFMIGTYSAEHILSEHLLLDNCFTITYFFMNWISTFFNISNFISSRSQVFRRRAVFKRLRKVHRKTLVLEWILIKMQASNLQFQTLIKDTLKAYFLLT